MTTDFFAKSRLSEYGLGIENYFRLIFSLFITLTIIAFVTAGLATVYKLSGNLFGERSLMGNAKLEMSRFTLGAVQGSKPICSQVLLDVETRKDHETVLVCPKGNITKLFYQGVYSSHGSDGTPAFFTKLDKSTEYVGTGYCGNPKDIDSRFDCSSVFNETAFQADFDKECLNKEWCAINLKKEQYYKVPMKNGKLVNTTLCPGKNRRFYIQAVCNLPEEKLAKNKFIAVVAVTVMLLVSAWYFLKIMTFQNMNKHQCQLDDLKKVSLSDYSIMIDLRRDIEYGDDWWLGFLEK